MWVIALLWSINERLGNNPGYDFIEPNQEWMDDLEMLERQDALYEKQGRKEEIESRKRRLSERYSDG